MTKGQVEARISEAVSSFEINVMGRGPKQIKTMICQDMIIIRLLGFLSQAERKLAESSQGVDLLKRTRTAVFESARNIFEEQIKAVLDIEITSIHSDVSTRTGEKVIVITTGESMEGRFSR